MELTRILDHFVGQNGLEKSGLSMTGSRQDVTHRSLALMPLINCGSNMEVGG